MPADALPQPLAPPAPAVWLGTTPWVGTDPWAVAHPRNISVVWGQPRTRQLVVKLRSAVPEPV